MSYDPNKTYFPSGEIIRQFAHAFVVGIGSMLALIILMIQAIMKTMMRALVLISLWLGALLLIPSGAHVLEMPHKLAMDRAAYFSAQQMYLGWALFGLLIVLKIILDAVLAFVWRRTSRLAACGALISAALIGCGLIVFFVWVQPANIATSNWATQPSDWVALRQNWEYGHLAIAVLTALSFCGISYSAITFRPAPKTPHRHAGIE